MSPFARSTPMIRARRWNATFLDIFPEQAGQLRLGDSARDILRRFYQCRLGQAGALSIDRFVAEGLERYRSQQSPYEFDHRNHRLRVSSFTALGLGRVRLWKKVGVLVQETGAPRSPRRIWTPRRCSSALQTVWRLSIPVTGSCGRIRPSSICTGCTSVFRPLDCGWKTSSNAPGAAPCPAAPGRPTSLRRRAFRAAVAGRAVRPRRRTARRGGWAQLLHPYRHHSLAAWMGGEEFVLLLPGANDQQALAMAERVRLTVQQTAFDPPSTFQ